MTVEAFKSALIFREDPTFYETDNVFWIPAEAKFSALLEKAAALDFVQQIEFCQEDLEGIGRCQTF